MMSTAPVTDPDTGRQQLAAVPFQVVCRESALSRTPQSGSIKDLAAITAQVRADNTQDNSIYGLWTESDSLGPTQTISVGDFEWVTPGPPTQPQDGFRLSIDSTSPYAILYIDVGKINLIPGSGVTVQKNDQVLPKCGSPPCVADLGDTNNRVIRLMITAGDPRFTFTGFRKAEGLEGIGPEGIVLTRASPSALDGAVKLHNNIPTDKFESARVTDYRLNDDGFSLSFSIEPPELFDPVTIGFDVTKMGFAPGGAITVEGLPLCEGAPAAGAGGTTFSVGGVDCPQQSTSFTVTALYPASDNGKTVTYFHNPRASGKCGEGIWVVDNHLIGGEEWGAIKYSTGIRYATQGGVGRGSDCGTDNAAIAAATAGRACGQAGAGHAVTDINSESSSLPTTAESRQTVPLVTGFAADTLTIQGLTCRKGADSGTKVYPTPEQPVSVYDCGSSEYRAVYDDSNVAGGIVYQSVDTKFYRTDSSGKPVGGSGRMSRDENIAALGGTPPSTPAGGGTVPTGEGAAPSGSTPSGTGTSRTGGTTGATVGPGVGNPLLGTARAGQPCYVVDGDVVGVKTFGAGGTITVKGLGRSEEEEVSSLNDVIGMVVLTAPNPAKNGLSAFGLSGSGRVIIQGITAPVGTTIPMQIQVDQDPGVRFDINLYHAKLKTTPSTTVDVAGFGSLPDCEVADITEACVLSMEESKIVLFLPRQDST
ncbi:hypothetical protein HZB90_01855 [archaeon]|nr:hypothetical protein [archaeon]